MSSLDSASLESAISDTFVNQVIEVIRSNGDDCNSKLNSTGLILSVKSIFKVFQGLNSERVPGLCFYKWVRDKNPYLSWNAHVCSLMIDNCGQVGDYDTLTFLLKEFKGKRICLTDKAFEFLTMCVSLSEVEGMVMIRVLVDVLNEVGGSCRGSGICAMIKMLCTLDLFEMAMFVMELTERNVSYYNILMADRCKRHHFEEARGLLEEMRGVGCEVEADTYNYMLGSLCKSGSMYEACSLLEEMLGNNTPPTAITFEIFICFLCRIGKLDIASQFYSQMMSRGLEVRITTHAAFLEGYFKAGKYEEAHRYVQAVGVGVQSSNMVYSLLAKLHQKKGDLVVAQRVLINMMDKGLKPYFPIYMDIIKGLKKNRRRHLADDLKRGFSRFYVESRMKTG